MNQKRLAERRARSLGLAQRDAANRCTACRRELPKVGALLMLSPGGEQLRYCDEDCRLDHAEALQVSPCR